ncbi:MAG: B12-binding domain-containing radical SAM protein [Magnetococcales bacterium]|nr:B12-binding domain-containing radical SAM protein [Magnetococcales bacterium]
MKIERILLIDVELDKNAGGDDQLQGRWVHHPIGLMYLVSSVKAVFPDIEFRIIHTPTISNYLSTIHTVLEEFQPDLIGLRALSMFQKQFDAAAQLIRKYNSELFLVGGGPYPSGSYEHLLENNLVDLVVIGEGERTFTELITSLKKNSNPPITLPGLAFLDSHGKAALSPERAPIKDLDQIPFPAYDHIELKEYSGLSAQSLQNTSSSAFIFATRGCPYRCFYCSAAFTKKVRKRSPENIVEEMGIHYHEKGLREFVFCDDIFNVTLTASKKILTKIAENFPDIKVNFSNGLRADQMDMEFIDLLQEVGATHLAVAIESATPRLQRMIGKYLNIEKSTEIINELSKRFVVCGFFMVGFPTETFDEAMATVNLAKDLPDMAQPVLSIVRIYRGTPLFDFLEPTKKQILQLDEQSAFAMQPKLKGDESDRFYGDFFSDEKVPLKDEDIRLIRWEWARQVVFNGERIRNGQKVLEKHYNQEQILSFYRNFLDNPDYSINDMQQLLRIK